MEYTPSTYQQDIFEYFRTIAEQKRNLIVKAAAGSGKTSTLCTAVNEFLPYEYARNSLFVAFSKAIQEELQARMSHMRCKTFHAECLWHLKLHFKQEKNRRWVNLYKLGNLADEYAKEMFPNADEEDKEIQFLFKRVLEDSVEKCMLTMTDMNDIDAYEDLVDMYDLYVDTMNSSTLFAATREVMRRAKANVKVEISFPEMLYYAVTENIYLPTYDVIMTDESQDTSNLARHLLKKLSHKNTRLIFVGDKFQSIFGFAGAEPNSMDLIETEFDCESKKLPITYRCPTSAVDLAKQVNPDIEPAANAIEGEIYTVRFEDVHKYLDPKRGDLVMCRLTAPLITLAFGLLKEGMPVHVKGRGLTNQIAVLAKAVMKQENANWPEFLLYTENYGSKQIELIKQQKGNTETRIQNLQDRIEALITIYSKYVSEKGYPTKLKDLINFMSQLYGPEKGSITLCTVHRAKGLEAKVTVVLGTQLLPFSRATKKWQVEQELNLTMVAQTRHKETMYLCSLPPTTYMGKYESKQDMWKHPIIKPAPGIEETVVADVDPQLLAVGDLSQYMGNR